MESIKKLKCKKCGNDFPITQVIEIGNTTCSVCYEYKFYKRMSSEEILKVMMGQDKIII